MEICYGSERDLLQPLTIFLSKSYSGVSQVSLRASVVFPDRVEGLHTSLASEEANTECFPEDKRKHLFSSFRLISPVVRLILKVKEKSYTYNERRTN